MDQVDHRAVAQLGEQYGGGRAEQRTGDVARGHRPAATLAPQGHHQGRGRTGRDGDPDGPGDAPGETAPLPPDSARPTTSMVTDELPAISRSAATAVARPSGS